MNEIGFHNKVGNDNVKLSIYSSYYTETKEKYTEARIKHVFKIRKPHILIGC
jgi:hypothetical protein